MSSSQKDSILLPGIGSWSRSAHQFSEHERGAIKAAEITGRPLLIRGEPGLGKSQIARAIAAQNHWPLITHVVNARTEIDDLLYRVDHVRRLSDAHLMAASQQTMEKGLGGYIDHGPVWRALYLSAGKEIEYTDDCYPSIKDENFKGYYEPAQPGCVLLIDEIDKAPPDVPNALLEVLSEMQFVVPQTGETIAGDKQNLRVIITANDERDLSAAFIRRCAALELSLGSDPQTRLCSIGRAHVASELIPPISDNTIEYAAGLVVKERNRLHQGNYRPGTSEFLDLLKVAGDFLQNGNDQDQLNSVLDQMGNYLIRKSIGGAETHGLRGSVE